jgi:small subunit ribosomal protein S17
VKNKKTIVVRVDYLHFYPKLGFHHRRTKRFMAHDEQEIAQLDDLVRIVPSRPMSAQKRHTLFEIVRATPESIFSVKRSAKASSYPDRDNKNKQEKDTTTTKGNEAPPSAPVKPQSK